jgi:hypothetical protein
MQNGWRRPELFDAFAGSQDAKPYANAVLVMLRALPALGRHPAAFPFVAKALNQFSMPGESWRVYVCLRKPVVFAVLTALVFGYVRYMGSIIIVMGRAPRGRPPKTWIEYVREDLVHLSELHGVFGTYMNWWLQCKDRKSWTVAIHKLKQTTDVEREQFGL